MSYLKKALKEYDVKEKGNVLYGQYKHFPLVAQKGANDWSRSVTVSFCGDSTTKIVMDNTLSQQLNALQSANKKFRDYRIGEHSVEFFIQQMSSERKQSKLIISILDTITNVLRQNGCTQGCSSCGSDTHMEWYSVGNSAACLCDTCSASVIKAAKAEQDAYDNTEVNYFMGLVGAVLGTLAACAIFILILQLNRILISALLPLIPFGLFGAMGKKLNLPGSILTCIIYITGFFLATRLGMVWYISRETGLDFSALWTDLGYFVEKYEPVKEYFMSVYIKGFGVSALVAVIAAIALPLSANKNSVKKL